MMVLNVLDLAMSLLEAESPIICVPIEVPDGHWQQDNTSTACFLAGAEHSHL